VTTKNVCRWTRSAIRPKGTATTAPTIPASGSKANTTFPVSCQSLAAIPTV
jgi:hypothetical protein